jgi:transcriptional accessory protein Tex/SPT6
VPSFEQTGVTEAAVRDVIAFLKVPQCDPRATAAPPLLKQGVASLADVVSNRCIVTAL